MNTAQKQFQQSSLLFSTVIKAQIYILCTGRERAGREAKVKRNIFLLMCQLIFEQIYNCRWLLQIIERSRGQRNIYVYIT